MKSNIKKENDFNKKLIELIALFAKKYPDAIEVTINSDDSEKSIMEKKAVMGIKIKDVLKCMEED